MKKPTMQVHINFFASSTEQPHFAKTGFLNCIISLRTYDLKKIEHSWFSTDESNSTKCPLQQLSMNSRGIFCLTQSLAIEVHSFFWGQPEHSLKSWLGEANLLWHRLCMLPEVWKVHGLIPTKWPATFFRQLCHKKPVRPAVRKEMGLCPEKAESHHFPSVSKTWCSMNTAGVMVNTQQL